MVRMWLLLALLLADCCQAKNRWLAGATTKAKKVLKNEAKQQIKNEIKEWIKEGVAVQRGGGPAIYVYANGNGCSGPQVAKWQMAAVVRLPVTKLDCFSPMPRAQSSGGDHDSHSCPVDLSL